MTPVILTATIAAFGLVPFLFATGPGAEIQRPLAIVVIGGLVTATVLTLVMLPILYSRFALPKAAIEAGMRNPEHPASPLPHPPAPHPGHGPAAPKPAPAE